MSGLNKNKIGASVASIFRFSKKINNKQTEQKLQEAEEKFSAAFNASPDLMAITKFSDGTILEVNEGYSKLLGFTRAESIGKTTTELLIWGNAKGRQKFVDLLLKTGQVIDFETTLRRKNGTMVTVLDSARIFTFQGEKCVLSIAHDITNRKQFEAVLKEKEEKYYTLIQKIEAGVVVHGPDTKILVCNSAAQEILGLTEDQLLGKTAFDPTWSFFKEDGSVANVMDYPVNLVIKTKKPLRNYILRVHRSNDKNDVWVLISADTILNKNGKIVQVVVTFVDVTKRKINEIEREQFFRFFNLSTDIMVIADPNGAFKKVNPTCLNLLGYTEKELLSKSFIDFVYCDDKQPTLDEMAKQIKIGSSLNFENRYLCKGGKVVWLSWRATFNKAEGLTYATARDITEKKLAEIAIDRKNRALKIVSGINQSLIHITDENVLLNDACHIAVEIGGYLLAWVGFAVQDKNKMVEVVARAGSGSTYLDDIKIVWANNEYGRGPTGSAIRTGKTQMSRNISIDPKMIPWRKSAKKYGFKSSIALPLINNRKTFGTINIYSGEIDAFNDDEVRILEELASDLSFGIITQRNRAEQLKMVEVIKSNESALKEAQRIGHFGNWSWDMKTDKIVWSDEYYRIIGFDPKKSPPGYKDHLKIYTSESAARLDEAVKRNIKTGESYILDLEIATPNATCQWITARSESVYDAHGKIIGLRGTAQDITEAKKIDQMKSEFVSLASHQLRTPLTGIKWLSELLMRDPEKTLTADQNDLMNGIVMSTKRTINLVDDLLDVSRIDTGKNLNLNVKPVDVVTLINFAINEKRPLINQNNLTVELSDALSKPIVLKVDKEKIQQVFENLLDNALKFSTPGSKINIGANFENNQVTFFVKDNGVGIPLANQSKIFARFYRADNATKIDNTGTGLGLYIAKGIIEYHHGKIWFESKEGKGSIFYFSLPLAVDLEKK